MAPFTESAITLDFPDNLFFRLCDCPAYREIQHNCKEMDICWYDQSSNTLYLIELKQWDSKLLEEEDTHVSREEIAEKKKGILAYRLKNLLKKSIDTSCMFMSVLLAKPHGHKIGQCAPFTINGQTSVILLSIIDWQDPDNTYLSVINDQYRSKFKPYAKLFDIRTYLIMSKKQAQQHFGWVR
jgi:hypothetical protein